MAKATKKSSTNALTAAPTASACPVVELSKTLLKLWDADDGSQREYNDLETAPPPVHAGGFFMSPFSRQKLPDLVFWGLMRRSAHSRPHSNYSHDRDRLLASEIHKVIGKQQDNAKVLVRLPLELKTWLEQEERNWTSQNAEIIRAIRSRMESEQRPERAAG
jgi:hypothetical protein